MGDRSFCVAAIKGSDTVDVSSPWLSFMHRRAMTKYLESMGVLIPASL